MKKIENLYQESKKKCQVEDKQFVFQKFLDEVLQPILNNIIQEINLIEETIESRIGFTICRRNDECHCDECRDMRKKMSNLSPKTIQSDKDGFSPTETILGDKK